MFSLPQTLPSFEGRVGWALAPTVISTCAAQDEVVAFDFTSGRSLGAIVRLTRCCMGRRSRFFQRRAAVDVRRIQPRSTRSCRPAIKRPEKTRYRSSRSDAERCERLSIHSRARRIWRESITRK